MTLWLADPDVTLYHGDVLDVLRDLPAGSVDCCVTSPPYWGLRDYGTGAWEGGDEGCDHKQYAARPHGGLPNAGANSPEAMRVTFERLAEEEAIRYRDTCGKCGATRIDQQLGLEPTPEQYVERMVEVFREVRRVLAAHGTVWLNLGDSYAGSGPSGASYQSETTKRRAEGDGTDGNFRISKTLADRGLTYAEKKPIPPPGLKQKDLCGIPWRVAFALQADGWYLRSDIIWAKPNPMPESVTDRPTKAHEYVFLLSKQPRYFFDQEAVREEWSATNDRGDRIGFRGSDSYTQGRSFDNDGERVAAGGNSGDGAARGPDGRKITRVVAREGSAQHRDGERWPNGGRNIRSVWEIATQPYPEAHFATFPEELARRCIAAGCPEQVCRVCGKARERVTSVEQERLSGSKGRATRKINDHNWEGVQTRTRKHVTTLGFTDCACLDPCPTHDFAGGFCHGPCPDRVIGGRYRPGTVLDPFMGSGTVAYVARKLGRRSIGIDLNESYLELAARRLQQQSLFASEVPA